MFRHLHRLTAAIAHSQSTSRHLGAAVTFLFVLFLTPTLIKGQSDTPHAYVAQITGIITELDEKLVYEALNGWEAVGHIEVSRVAHRMKFDADQPVNEGDLTERLAGTGTSVFWFAEVQQDGSLSSASFEAHAFPMYDDTGDPAADNARYDAEKAAWLAAHPDWVDLNTRPAISSGSESDHVK